jgi:sulfinoalanine decarboxylase/sulfinoalanine decarboxylase/aspartate 1-decarboxylase
MVGVEKAIIQKSCDMIGMKNGVGTFASGGSITNLMSMIMARDWADKDARFWGVRKNLITYTSIDSHYSISKNASFIGLGRKNVRFIDVDKFGKMIPQKLEEAILKDINDGHQPFYINATSGTTVLGAFDPIVELSTIARKHKLWLHADGAYCGASFLSEKHKEKLEGLDLVDSFSYNGHKMLNTPTNCSIILTKHKEALYNSFSTEASYLFQKDTDEFNFGKTSMQCGRRNDALKLWTLWKAIGTEGLGGMIDHLYETADTAFNYVTNHPDYTVHSFSESLSVCFNYKNIDAKTLSHKLHDNGVSMVSYAELRGETFIRFVNINTENSNEDILNFFAVLEDFVVEHEEEFQNAWSLAK